MSDGNPQVSIIMAAYNSAAYIDEAIQSILNQSFSDWELLIIDDCSKDNTLEKAKIFSKKDDRIKLIKNDENQGVVKTRNKGILNSKGKFIAILDSDDVAYPDRLQKQINFFESNPDYLFLGAACKIINSKGIPVKQIDRNIPNKDLKTLLLFSNYFINSTVMMRKDAIQDLSYREGLQLSEDYELVTRICRKGKIANLNEPLVNYRIHDSNISGNSTHLQEAVSEVHAILLKELALDFNEEELSIHSKLVDGPFPEELKDLEAIDIWLMKIGEANKSCKLYDELILIKYLDLFLKRSCENSKLGTKALSFYFGSGIRRLSKSNLLGILKFILKTLINSYVKH